jgi:hypothetical protein
MKTDGIFNLLNYYEVDKPTVSISYLDTIRYNKWV